MLQPGRKQSVFSTINLPSFLVQGCMTLPHKHCARRVTLPRSLVRSARRAALCKTSLRSKRTSGLHLETLEDRKLLAGDWRNPALAGDVDYSGFVSIADALAVVAELRVKGNPHGLTIPPVAPNVPPPFVDVTGDDQANIADLLGVVTLLRNGSGLAAPELQAALANDTPPDTSDGITSDARIAGRITANLQPSTHLVARLDQGPWTSIVLATDGSFTWTPPSMPTDGPHTVRLTTQTFGGPFSQLDVTFTFTGQRVTLVPISPLNVTAGQTVEAALSATSASGNPITFMLASDMPLPGGRLRPDNVLEFTPGPDDVGQYDFEVIASDGVSQARQTVSLTVVADPVGTTRLSGVVLGTDSQPIPGLRVSLGAISVLTDASGKFLIDAGSAGPFISDTLRFHGNELAGDKAYPFVAEKLELMFGHEVFLGALNQIRRPVYSPVLDVAGGTQINPAQDTTVSQEVAPGETAEVFVAAGTLFNQQGSPFQGVLSITEVPPDLTPAALPNNLAPALVVTIQPGEMTFASPAPVTFPNRDGWAPGVKMDLWSINPVTGEFDDVGDGVVSDDGTQVVTTSGGVRNSSWHFFVPPPDEPDVDDDKDECKECEEEGDFSSTVRFATGAVIETHALPTYSSLGQSRGVELVYDSLRANPQSIFRGSIGNVSPAFFNPPDALRMVMSASVNVNGVEVAAPGFDQPGEFGLMGGENFFTVPAGGGRLDARLMVDLSDQPTGLYPYTVTIGLRGLSDGRFTGASDVVQDLLLHENGRNSPFGAGWNIAGLQAVVEGPNGFVAVFDGSGESQLYTPVAGNPLQFTSPPGDFSRLEKLAGVGYRRTMTDQSVEEFDAAGRITAMRDRNGNETRYEYDTGGNLLKIIDPVGLETTFAYAQGRVTSITDPAGRVTQLQYDAAGNLTRITDPDNTSRQFEYDARRLMTAEVTKRGFREEITYDAFGRAQRAERPDGSTVNITPLAVRGLYPATQTQDPMNAPLAVRTNGESVYVTPTGNTIRTQLDGAGQLISESDNLGPLPTVQRDGNNLVTRSTDARGNITLYTYDARGNLLTVEDPISAAGGGEVAGTITEPGELDVFTFEGTAGQVVYFDTLDGDTDGIATQLRSPSGRSLLSIFSFNGNIPDFDRGPIVLPETGTYRLEIGGTEFTGDYRFRLLDLANAPEITLGATVNAQLPSGLHAHLYRFTGTAGQQLTFDSLMEQQRGNWAIRAISPSVFGFVRNEVLGEDFDAGLPADGEYVLIVRTDFSNPDPSPLDYRFQVRDAMPPPVTPSGFGVVHTGTLATGEMHEFSLMAPAGLLMYFDGLSREFSQVSVRLVDSNDNFVTSANRFDLDAVGNVARGMFAIPASGEYTQKISGTGNYSYRWIDVQSAAQHLNTGALVQGTLDPNTQTHFYRLEGTAGQRLYFDGQMGTTSLMLYDPFGGFHNNSARLGVTGPHYLAVYDNSFQAPPTLDYQFRVLDVADLPVVSLDQEIAGTVNPFVDDVYRFNGTAGQRLFFQSLESTFEGRLQLLGPAGQLVADTFNFADNLEAILPADGEYLLAATNNTANPIDYRFHLGAPNTTTSPVTLGQVVNATLADPGEIHRYTFTGAAGQRMYFDALAEIPFFDMPPIEVQDEHGNVVAANLLATALVESRPFTLPRDGQYVLHVGGDEQTSTYSFRLLDAGAAPLLQLGMPTSETLSPGYQSDVYRVPGQVGQRLQFDSLADPGNGSWDLYGPTNQPLSEFGAPPIESDFTHTLPSDGEYLLVLRGGQQADLNYQFQVNDQSEAPVTPMGFGQRHMGSLASGETMTFTYQASAGDFVYYDALDTGSVLRMELRDPDDQVIYSAGASFDTDLILPRSGEYTLEFTTPNGADDFDFRLLRPASDSTPIAFGAEIMGQTGGTEFYRFDGAAGQVLFIDQLAASSLEFRIISSSGQMQNAALETTETHFVQIRQTNGSDPVDYRFQLLDLSGLPETALPTDLTGALEGGREAEAYRFTGEAGQRVFLNMRDTPFAPITFQLLDGAGRTITQSGGGSDLEATLSFAGSYYLVLDGTAEDTFAYRFRMAEPTTSEAPLPDSQPAGPVTYAYDATFSQVTSYTDERGRQTLYEIAPANGNALSMTEVVGANGGNDD